jgi:hypothetical protein
LFVVMGLCLEGTAAPGERAEHGGGGGGLGVPAGLDAQLGCGGNHGSGALAPEPCSQHLGSSGDKRVELALGIRGTVHCGAAGSEPDRQCGPVACCPRLGEVLTGEGFPRGAYRVDEPPRV